MATMAYRDALRMALHEEMTRDERVILMGEEVGLYGGAYAVSKGLLDAFGPERVIDTPISEASIVGVGVGAALTGLRPVVELMYVDFLGLVMDQLGNQAAKWRYMSGGRLTVPMVLRTQGGTGRSAGAQHSQSLESWIMHVPGLRLVMPATPADARGLLKTAIRSDDPVVFIEHKALYALKGEVPDEAEPIPFGQARVALEGGDVSILTYSRMVHVALEAAERMREQGVAVEVIDLRTLNPLDLDAITASVRKTGRAIVVSEAHKTCSVSSELATLINEHVGDALLAPVRRVAGKDVPIPSAPALERAAVPSVDEVVEAIVGTGLGKERAHA
jgi:acetoin:2,6-dichlorophenolindophenol oxidoreductase subunit beta